MRLIDADKTIGHIKTRLLETALNNSMVVCDASYIYQDCADNRIETWVDEMPTVEPIKHGHWIERTKVHPDLMNDSTYNYECSNCGYMDTHGANVEVPYCWHCGAKMDEVAE